MESQKTINSLEKTSENKDLVKKKIIVIVKKLRINFFYHKLSFYCIKMGFKKIVNFLDTTSDDKDLPNFVTKKRVEVYDQSEGNYDVNKEVRIKASILGSDLRDFSDSYVVVKGTLLKKHLLLMILMHQIIQRLI